MEINKESEESIAIDELLEELKFHQSVDVEKNWNKLSARIAGLSFRIRLLQFCKTAAAVLFLPLLLLSGYYYYRTTARQSTAYIEQTSAPGLISSIILPDGTGVWLNSGSKIIYPARFRDYTRVVKMEGEAYFKVHADKKHRFDVELIDGSRVSAYGTEFNISAYTGNNHIEVVLAKGNAEVINKKNQSFSLMPEYQLTLDDNKSEYEKINVYTKTAWKDGKMVFRHAGMKEIAQKLALRYNADIELEDEEIYNYQLNATFTTEPLTQVLRLIEKSIPISYTIIESVKSDDMSYTKRKIIIRSIKESITNIK